MGKNIKLYYKSRFCASTIESTSFKSAKLVQSDFSKSQWAESEAESADVSFCNFHQSTAIDILSRAQRKTMLADDQNRQALDDRMLEMNVVRMQR